MTWKKNCILKASKYLNVYLRFLHYDNLWLILEVIAQIIVIIKHWCFWYRWCLDNWTSDRLSQVCFFADRLAHWGSLALHGKWYCDKPIARNNDHLGMDDFCNPLMPILGSSWSGIGGKPHPPTTTINAIDIFSICHFDEIGIELVRDILNVLHMHVHWFEDFEDPW